MSLREPHCARKMDIKSTKQIKHMTFLCKFEVTRKYFDTNIITHRTTIHIYTFESILIVENLEFRFITMRNRDEHRSRFINEGSPIVLNENTTVRSRNSSANKPK